MERSTLAGSIGRIAAIAAISSREALRSRAMLIAVILNVLYLAIFAIVAYVVWTSQLAEAATADPRVRESAVRSLLLFGIAGASTLALFTGVFASVGAINTEIERGTILALAARPVARWEIVLGKFLGNSLLALAYLVVQALVIGLAISLLTGVWVPELLAALGLLGLNVLVMVAVAIAGSTRLNTVANGIVVIVLFLGLTNTGLLYGLGELFDVPLLKSAAEWVRLVLPVGIVSDLAGEVLLGPAAAAQLAEAGGGRSLLPTYPWIWIYSLGYLLVVLLFASWSLTQRDLR